MSARTLLIALFASTTLVSVGCGGDSPSTTGAAGTTGRGGTTGAAGTTAAAGTNGAAGTTAAAGTNGAAGTTAAAGTTGAAGTTAAAGTTGAAGTTATAGTSGAAGTTGNAGRGGTTGNAGRGGTTGTGGSGGGGTFRITSTTLADGAMFPVDSTCATTMTRSMMPDLTWTGAPAGTMSFAIVFADATLVTMNPPMNQGYHSAIWDIPANVSMLPYGLAAGSPPAGVAGLETAKQRKEPSGMQYLGPCPNFGGTGTTGPTTDTYEFRLYAMPVATLPNVTATTNTQTIQARILSANPLGMAVLTGRSNARGNLK